MRTNVKSEYVEAGGAVWLFLLSLVTVARKYRPMSQPFARSSLSFRLRIGLCRLLVGWRPACLVRRRQEKINILGYLIKKKIIGEPQEHGDKLVTMYPGHIKLVSKVHDYGTLSPAGANPKPRSQLLRPRFVRFVSPAPLRTWATPVAQTKRWILAVVLNRTPVEVLVVTRWLRFLTTKTEYQAPWTPLVPTHGSESCPWIPKDGQPKRFNISKRIPSLLVGSRFFLWLIIILSLN